ncbi:MAG: HD domain-containing protein [Pseudomonadales bacterium]|nr:HD domain-containing protein [Pseudomonadales bacterium]
MEQTQLPQGYLHTRLLTHIGVTRQLCEAAMLKYEENPEDCAPLDSLQISLGNIRQSLSSHELTLLASLVCELENLIQAIRMETIHYHSTVTDIVLLSLECIQSKTKKITEGSFEEVSEERLRQIIASLQMILNSDKKHHQNAVRASILVLDPTTQIEHIELQQLAMLAPPEPSDSLTQLFTHYGVEKSADLEFFSSLTAPIEARSQYWHGRSERILRLALEMNHHAHQPVDPTQLAAAVYMHDISMAFLPLDILHKQGPLNRNEKRILHGHARSSYEMLHRMMNWEEAAEMVHQHHEHMNGAGYPNRLTEKEICDGAKIIAIVDTFDARTHERAHTTLLRRPFARALLELNRETGTQFSRYWVDIFNHIIRNPDQTKLHVID